MPSLNEVNPMICSWEGKKVHDSSVARHLFPHPTKPFLQVIWKACPRKRITELPERHEIGFPIKAMSPWQLSWRSALVCLHSTLHSRTWHILTLDTNGIKRISNKSQNYWCWSIRFSAWKYNHYHKKSFSLLLVPNLFVRSISDIDYSIAMKHKAGL